MHCRSIHRFAGEGEATFILQGKAMHVRQRGLARAGKGLACGPQGWMPLPPAGAAGVRSGPELTTAPLRHGCGAAQATPLCRDRALPRERRGLKHMMKTITTSRASAGDSRAVPDKSRVSAPALSLEIPGITQNHAGRPRILPVFVTKSPPKGSSSATRFRHSGEFTPPEPGDPTGPSKTFARSWRRRSFASCVRHVRNLHVGDRKWKA